MKWLLGAMVCVAVVEVVLRLPFLPILTKLGRYGTKAVHVIRASAVSDHWKEKAVGAYAQGTFLLTLQLAGLLALLVSIVWVLVLAGDAISSGFQSFMLSWTGGVFCIVFACLYVALRKSISRGKI